MDRDRIDKLIAELRALRDESSPREPEAAWLAKILTHSPDVIGVHDRDGTILYINKTRPPHTVASAIGQPIKAFFPAEQHAPLDDALQRAIETNEPQQFETTSNGGYVWSIRMVPIVQDGRATQFLSIVSDITAQRHAEEALRAKDELLHLALAASGMGQWRWNVASNRIIWDEAAKEILGWPLDNDDVDFAQYLERVHPEDRVYVREQSAQAVATGRYSPIEHRVVLGGVERWVLTTGKVVFDANDEATHLIGGVLDITNQKKREQSERRAQKLEAIGQLAGGIAHDFNNLLVAIVGNIDLAKLSEDKTEQFALMNDALAASVRAADLTKQLLAFGRRSQVHETALDMRALLDDTVKLLARLIPESIRIDHLGATKLPLVLGDRGQLEQVVVNLCVNARDAMPDGGRLVLETEVVVINGRYRESHPWARPGRYVLLSVSDTGRGIPPEAIDHIFEPFFTTKSEGTGLGLATVYGIVKQHGGLVHVYSEVGKGTSFKVYFPIAERDAAEVGTKIEEPVRGGAETILVAEDEEPVRKVVSRILENAGYRVITASDGLEALEKFEAHRDEIDAVLLDAIMPRKSGTDVAAELRLASPRMVIVLSSGYSDALAADPSMAHRDIAFLAKPYEPDTLLRTVRSALDRAAQSR